MTIATLLRVLFSAMFLLVIGLLLQPIWGDLEQRTESAMVVRHARAASAIFAALQNLRTERGPTRTTLEGTERASATFIAITAALRAKSQPALGAVVEQCAVIDCVSGRPVIFAGLRDSIARLTASRHAVDGELAPPLSAAGASPVTWPQAASGLMPIAISLNSILALARRSKH